jgi:hypothetical protein
MSKAKAKPSLARPFFTDLNWGERVEILSFLSLSDLQSFSQCSRGTWYACTRERSARKGAHLSSGASFLTRGVREREDDSGSGGASTLVSYPRSGNSLLRKLIESATGRITGSDSRANRTLSASLLRCGFIGEGIVDESVSVVKSHYPERAGYLTFEAVRGVLLVRNPFDAIESYFHMGFTNTHDRSLAPAAKQQLKASGLYEDFIRHEACVWVAFHRYWLARMKSDAATAAAAAAGIDMKSLSGAAGHGSSSGSSSSSGSGGSSDSERIPLLILRFEDLVADPGGRTRQVARFLRQPLALNTTTTTTTPPPPPPLPPMPHASPPKQAPSSSSSSAAAGYKARAGSRGPGGSLAGMSGDCVRAILEECGDVMSALGYRCEPIDESGDGTGEGGYRLIIDPCPMSPAAAAGGSEPEPEPEPESGGSASITMNSIGSGSGPGSRAPFTVRSRVGELSLEKYGRNITDLRRGLTDKDTKPFPTI